MEYVMQNLSEKLFMPWVNGKKNISKSKFTNSQFIKHLYHHFHSCILNISSDCQNWLIQFKFHAYRVNREEFQQVLSTILAVFSYDDTDNFELAIFF